MAYTRSNTINPGPGGDSVKSAVIAVDADLTGVYADLNTHEGLAATHGATGAIVGTTNTQTLTNKTLTSPKINENVALTATATELNVLDGIPATLTATELGYVDGVTSSIQTQLNNKHPLGGASNVDFAVGTLSAYEAAAYHGIAGCHHDKIIGSKTGLGASEFSVLRCTLAAANFEQRTIKVKYAGVISMDSGSYYDSVHGEIVFAIGRMSATNLAASAFYYEFDPIVCKIFGDLTPTIDWSLSLFADYTDLKVTLVAAPGHAIDAGQCIFTFVADAYGGNGSASNNFTFTAL